MEIFGSARKSLEDLGNFRKNSETVQNRFSVQFQFSSVYLIHHKHYKGIIYTSLQN